MRILGIIAALLLTFSLPVFLAGSNLRYLASELRFYEYAFDKYQVEEATGLDKAELKRAAETLISYFNSDEGLRMRVTLAGQERDLFNEREVAHLKDVKDILRLCYRIQIFALGGVVLSVALAGGAFWRSLARGVLGAAALTLAALALLGIGVALDFPRLFLQFHFVSFTNELWRLDPARDYLIRLFPEGFFFEATLFIIGATALEAVILGAAAWAYLRLRKGGHR